MSQNPVAFLSYVRFDDAHESGRLTEFCERLSGEVRLQTGDKFHIFQDRNDIAWGQQWKQRIEESLDAATFLIPIITPGFFKSPPCKDEFERFLDREKRLGRNDLILPVYYVNCQILDDEAQWEADPLASVIASRQYADWRDLRFEPITSPQLRRVLAKMATQIAEALKRGKPKPSPVPVPAQATRQETSRSIPVMDTTPEATGQSSEAALRPAHKTEPPTLIVDAFHRGDHPTLTDALNAAKPGHRILVRPGLYREGIVIDKPVEIIGDGPQDEVVIEATGKDAVLFQANMGRIANLTLRQAGGGNWYGVDIAQGRLDIEGCDITSQGLACVAIHGGADPRLRRNRIHDGKSAGVLVYENGQGTLEDNEIVANAFAGVAILEGGNPSLRRNRIHDGKQGGVFVHENGQGTLEDNEIAANPLAGVEIKTGGNPTLRRNRIHDGKQDGVLVHGNGLGTLEDNEIAANAYAGVEIRKDGNPTLRRNRITKNAYEAIWVHDGGQGVFEDNDLRGNTKGAWDIAPDCLGKVTRNRNQE